MACNYCNTPIYVKVTRYAAPLLAPLTRAEELRQELINLTGEEFLYLPNQYCPMCGEKLYDRDELQKER